MPRCPYCDNEVDELELLEDEEPLPSRLTHEQIKAIIQQRTPMVPRYPPGAATVTELFTDELEGE